MNNIIREITNEQLRTDLPDFRPGDTLMISESKPRGYTSRRAT